jgi:flagellar hook-length control protein FliK
VRASPPQDKPATKAPASGGAAPSDNPPPTDAAAAPAEGDFGTVLKGHVRTLSGKPKQHKAAKGGAAEKDGAAVQTGQGNGLTVLFAALPAAASQGGHVAASGKTDGDGAALEGISAAKVEKHLQPAGGGVAQKKGKAAAELAAAGNGLPPDKVVAGKAKVGKAAADKGAVDDAAQQRPSPKVGTGIVPEKGGASASAKPEIAVPGKGGKDEPQRPIQGGDGRPPVALHGGVNPHMRTEVSTAAASQPGGTPVRLSVEPRVGTSGWDGALGQKVAWIATHNHQVAELHLNPPNLGPLEVRVSVSHDQASALFVSHHGAVRDAIEAALPRLREMFASNGLALGNVGVSSQSFSQQQQSFSGGGAQTGWQGAAPGLTENESLFAGHGASVVRTFNNGLVDIFA